MPIRMYECTKCQNMFELMFLPIQEKPKEVCPKCGSVEVKRIMTAPIIRMNPHDLETVPDPIPPLQRQKQKGSRVGYEGGYKDVPEMELKDMKSTRDEFGNRIWKEKERTIFSG